MYSPLPDSVRYATYFTYEVEVGSTREVRGRTTEKGWWKTLPKDARVVVVTDIGLDPDDAQAIGVMAPWTQRTIHGCIA